MGARGKFTKDHSINHDIKRETAVSGNSWGGRGGKEIFSDEILIRPGIGHSHPLQRT